MTAISVSFLNGVGNEAAIDDTAYTFGTSAPGAGDFEFRYNLTDTNSNTVTRLQILKAIEALKILFESNSRYTTASEG